MVVMLVAAIKTEKRGWQTVRFSGGGSDRGGKGKEEIGG